MLSSRGQWSGVRITTKWCGIATCFVVVTGFCSVLVKHSWHIPEATLRKNGLTGKMTYENKPSRSSSVSLLIILASPAGSRLLILERYGGRNSPVPRRICQCRQFLKWNILFQPGFSLLCCHLDRKPIEKFCSLCARDQIWRHMQIARISRVSRQVWLHVQC